MAGGQPQLHEGRDGLRQVIQAINQLRRQVAAQALIVYPLTINLLQLGPTQIVPAGATGFVPILVQIVLSAKTGAVVVPAQVEFGANATYDDVSPATVIPGATLVDEVLTTIPAATVLALGGPIFANVSVVATGVTEYQAECYAAGYWRL